MDINNGLPKGSTLSPILFNVMLHDIPVSPAVHNLLYADDCVIWKSGNDLRESSKHNYTGLLKRIERMVEYGD